MENVMSSGRAAALYAIVWIVVAAGAVIVTGTLFDLLHFTSRRPGSAGEWLLNVLPPAVLGFGVYWWLSGVVCRRQPQGRSPAMHFRRMSLLYLIAVPAGAVVLHDAPSQDFWGLGQLLLWPWLATVAGIAADAFTTLRGRVQRR
jgi:hypothetical protein